MNSKKKYIFLAFSISLSLITLTGIYFMHTPKSKILRAFHKTFLSPQAPLSITESLPLLQAESVSFNSTITLNQLKLPLFPPKLSSKLSLLEGLSLKSNTNYSWSQQKGNSILTLAYLYKPYLHASVYADQNDLFLEIPDLIEGFFSMQTTTLGESFNYSIFSELLNHKLPNDYGFTLFPSFFEKTINWKDVDVRKTKDSYLLQLPDFPPISLTLDSTNRISSIRFTYLNLICQFNLESNNITGDFTILDSLQIPIYKIRFKGSYSKQSAAGNAALLLSSVDITDEKGIFFLNLHGDIVLEDADPIETLPNGKVYELFHLTKQDILNLSAEITGKLITSELQPFLPYLK